MHSAFACLSSCVHVCKFLATAVAIPHPLLQEAAAAAELRRVPRDTAPCSIRKKNTGAAYLQYFCNDAIGVLPRPRPKGHASCVQGVLRRLPGHVQELLGQLGQLGHPAGDVRAIRILEIRNRLLRQDRIT